MQNEVRQADGVRAKLVVGERTYEIVSLREAERQGIVPASLLPISLKVMLENILRNNGDNRNADIEALCEWCVRQRSDREISFYPTRVLMPDSSGVPLVGDLAALRDALLHYFNREMDYRYLQAAVETGQAVDDSRVDHPGRPQMSVDRIPWDQHATLLEEIAAAAQG